MTEQLERASPWWLPPLRRVHPVWWGVVGAAIIVSDYVAGPAAQFPVLYVIPVTLAAWYSGRAAALWMAVAVPVCHVLFLMVWKPPEGILSLVAATALRAGVIIVMALWFARLAEHERRLHRYVLKLEGLLPICSFCKSIRNEKDQWEPLEKFVSARSNADFSHGLCPNCLKTEYPEM